MFDFEFLEPETLPEALSMLKVHGEEACVFAGGSALLLGMRQRMLAPAAVVSLGRLSGLRDISFEAGTGLRIGAMARHADVARSDAVRRHYPVLAQMAAGLANPQVRNQGTIGGNLCYADPSTDPPACLAALGAELEIAGPSGHRRVSAENFNVDFFVTALEPGEILTAIHLPPPPDGLTALYKRQLRTAAEHRPLANLALALCPAKAGTAAVRLFVGAATPVPQRMTRAEEFLTGRTITHDAAAAAADLVAEDLKPISDGRGDADLRRAVVRAVARRVIAEAGGLDWKETNV